MRRYLRIVLHFHTWQRTPRGFSLAGLACLLLAGLLSPIMKEGQLAPLVYTGMLGLFAVPNALAPFVFRLLVANRHHSLVPGFRTGLVIGLWLMVLVESALAALIDSVLGSTGHPLAWYELAMYLFLLVSVYHAVVQYSFTSWRRVILLCWIPWALVQLPIQFPGYFTFYFQNVGVMVAGFLVCLAGWGYGLRILRNDPPVTSRFQDAPIQSHGSPWAEQGRLAEIASVSGSLLGGYPDGHWATLQRTVIVVILFPLVPVAFSLLVMLLQWDASIFPQPYIYMAFCAAITGLPPAGMGELAARTRILWLRYGSDRLSHWRHLEFNLLRGHAYSLLLVAVISVVFLLPFADTRLVQNFPLFVLSLTLFNTYQGLCIRLWRWPGVITGVLTISTFIWMLLGVFAYQDVGNLAMVHMGEAILLSLTVIFRFLARRSFLGIDWMQIRPTMAGRMPGRTAG